MAPYSSSVAPSLPPEITSKILNFDFNHISSSDVHTHTSSGFCDSLQQQELSNMSKISRSWKLESQKRLFRAISISSSEQLASIVDSIVRVDDNSEGEDKDQGVRGFMLVIQIEIPPNQGTIADSHLISSLLNSTPNLTTLLFDNPSFTQFNSADDSILRSTPMLKNLIKLRIGTTDPNWHREAFDSIIVAAPNLKILTIQADTEYQGTPWTPRVFKKLEVLELNQIDPFLGKIWQPVEFIKLKVLRIDVKKTEPVCQQLSMLLLPFIQIVARSLKELTIRGVCFHMGLFSSLRSLEILSVEEFWSYPPLDVLSLLFSHSPFLIQEEPQWVEDFEMLKFPAKLAQLNIERYAGPSLPLSNLTKLKSISIGHIGGSYDFSTLPIGLHSLGIAKISLNDLEISLENLVARAVPFERLELGAWYDNEEIVDRCEGLRIDLVAKKVDWLI